MSQQFFTSIQLSAAAALPLNVQVGFQPARIELMDLTSIQSPTSGHGWKAVWQQNMVQGSAIVTAYNASLLDQTSYVATNGITLLNPLGAQQGQYGAVVSGFTNASPGVITVDSTYQAQITAGCFIKVSALADNQSGPDLDGVYYVASVTATTITLGTPPAGVSLPSYPPYVVLSPNTSSSAVYISGGYVTVIQNAQPVIPNPPYNIYNNVPSWWNQAILGFTIGTSCFASSGASDVILVACYDLMSP